MTVNIPISAELDTSGLNQQLADLTRRLNGTGDAIAKASKLQFNPIDRATLAMAERLERTMANIGRIAPETARRIQASGQGGAPIDQIDFGRVYQDPTQAARAQRQLFTLATGLGFSPMPAPGMAQPGGGNRPPTPYAPAPGGRFIPGIAPLFQAGLQAAGPMGGMVGAGMRGGAGAMGAGAGLGAGMLAGGAAALGFAAVQGIGAIIGGVRQNIGVAQQQSIVAGDLYRRMGGRASGNSQAGIQGGRDGTGLYGASDAIAVSYDEALQLGTLAARRGNITNQRTLAGDVAQGGGFARAYGFDPQAGVSAFAGLRGVGVTRDTDDQRRLGLAIAEGIARGGVFAKAEEYLAEIATYGETTTRATLTRANVEGYSAALSGLLATGGPGMDLRGAAGLIGQADQSLRRGGAAGEAGQAFIYAALRDSLGLDPIQAEQFQEGGAFETGRNAFGEGSMMGDFYRRNRLPLPEGVATDDTPMLSIMLDRLNASYTGPNRRVAAHAAASFFGVNNRQAMALLDMDPTERGGLASVMGDRALSSLSPTGIATMGRVGAAGGTGELNAIAREFEGRTGSDRLSPAERQALETARNAGEAGVEELRRVVAEIAASRGAEQTQGEQTRRSLQDIDKTLQDMARTLVSPLNTARDALLFLAGGRNRSMTSRELAASREAGEVAEADQERDAALSGLEERRQTAATEMARLGVLAHINPDSPADQAAARAARERFEAIETERAGIQAQHAAAVAAARSRPASPASPASPAARPGAPAAAAGTVNARALEFAALVEQHGSGAISRNLALGIGGNAIQESGAGANQVGDGGSSRGILQWNGARRANFRRLFGVDPDQATPDQQAQFTAWELTSTDRRNTERSTMANMQRFMDGREDTPANWAEAFSHYYERPNAAHANVPARRRYAEDLAGMPTAPPLPPGAPTDAVRNANPAGGGGVVMNGTVTGTVTVQTPDGRPAGPSAPLQGVFDRPRAYGSHGLNY